MLRLQINSKFAELLHRHDLDTYSRIIQTTIGEVVENNESRDVRRLKLDNQVLYLKRTKSEKTISAIESYARLRLAHSKPFKEMLHYKQLAKHGFDVAEVIAVGEELNYAVPQRGFIITAAVAGEDLAHVYQKATKTDQCLIMGQFGALLGRLHNTGFFGSTRLKDIIYSGSPSANPTLTLIDRETRNPYPKAPSQNGIIDRLLLNIRRQGQAGERFNEEQWQAFSENYCNALSSGYDIQADQLLQQILAIANRKERIGAPTGSN